MGATGIDSNRDSNGEPWRRDRFLSADSNFFCAGQFLSRPPGLRGEQHLSRHMVGACDAHSSGLLYKYTTMTSDQFIPANRCGYCGSTNYRRVVERDAQGVMRYGQRLVCSGCTREFADIGSWRRGQSNPPPSLPTAA